MALAVTLFTREARWRDVGVANGRSPGERLGHCGAFSPGQCHPFFARSVSPSVYWLHRSQASSRALMAWSNASFGCRRSASEASGGFDAIGAQGGSRLLAHFLVLPLRRLPHLVHGQDVDLAAQPFLVLPGEGDAPRIGRNLCLDVVQAVIPVLIEGAAPLSRSPAHQTNFGVTRSVAHSSHRTSSVAKSHSGIHRL